MYSQIYSLPFPRDMVSGATNADLNVNNDLESNGEIPVLCGWFSFFNLKSILISLLSWPNFASTI